MVRFTVRTLILVVALTLGAATQALAASPPSNDNRDSAQPIGALPVAVSGTTVGATVEITEAPSGCARTAGSVW